MEVTEEHRIAAEALAGRTLEDASHGAPAPVAQAYLKAVERLEYHEDGGGYWMNPNNIDEAQVVKGISKVFMGPDMHQYTPEEIRQHMADLAVLADLAEAQREEG